MSATDLVFLEPVVKSPSRLRPVISVFFLLCLFALFYHLGSAALFEPDEGRNAEIAREILLLQDWTTPHYNFVSHLDKPVFFYWLLALSYELFGVSEWSARLPSALAASGTIMLVFLWARRFFGLRIALWSGLILVTSVEFFALSRIVIFDMTLTLFITGSLFSFFWGQRAATSAQRRACHLLMYAAMGAATLVKGPIGLILPGMVILSYLFINGKWSLVRDIDLVPGVIVFLLAVAPWYVWNEAKNPGYLRYFLWEENILRFLTVHYNHTEPWYYFFAVLAVGFLPWTVLAPTIGRDLRNPWTGPHRDESLFLISWAVLPLLFFSLSASKLPHYILPVYPPLSILAGKAIADRDSSAKNSWPLWLPALTLFFVLFMSILAALWPALLPLHLEEPLLKALRQGVRTLLLLGLPTALILFAWPIWKGMWTEQSRPYLFSCIGFVLLLLLVQPVEKAVSLTRSSKALVEKSAGLIPPEGQIVLYERYLSSLPFYLHIHRPIWVVSSVGKSKIMGSAYIAEERPKPAVGYGKVLYTHAEFAEAWKASDRSLWVFAEDGDAARLMESSPSLPKTVLQVGAVSLVTDR